MVWLGRGGHTMVSCQTLRLPTASLCISTHYPVVQETEHKRHETEMGPEGRCLNRLQESTQIIAVGRLGGCERPVRSYSVSASCHATASKQLKMFLKKLALLFRKRNKKGLIDVRPPCLKGSTEPRYKGFQGRGRL